MGWTEVGISVRTVFRYVTTKEETILGPMTDIGAVLAQQIRDIDAACPAWDALVQTITGFAGELADEGEQGKARSRLLVQTPQLRGGLSDKRRRWTDAMAPAVQERLPAGPHNPVIARALVSAALSALDAVGEYWAFCERELRLASLVRRTFAALGPSGNQIPGS